MDNTTLQNVMTLLSALASLVVVLLLAYFTIRWMGRRMSLQSTGKVIQVIDRAVIGQDKCLMVVKVCDQTMLIGMTGNAVTKLADLPECPSAPEAQTGSDFADVLKDTLRGGFGGHAKKGDKPQ